MRKADRQRLIESLVSRRRIGTQGELLAELARSGCRVTQATVSRDIRELALQKTRDALGQPRFVARRPGDRTDPRETLAAILARFGNRAEPAQNIVVVHTELGSAPAVGRALDELGHRLIVGTLAGDDTCLVVTRSSAEARTVAAELQDLLGSA